MDLHEAVRIYLPLLHTVNRSKDLQDTLTTLEAYIKQEVEKQTKPDTQPTT